MFSLSQFCIFSRFLCKSFLHFFFFLPCQFLSFQSCFLCCFSFFSFSQSFLLSSFLFSFILLFCSTFILTSFYIFLIQIFVSFVSFGIFKRLLIYFCARSSAHLNYTRIFWINHSQLFFFMIEIHYLAIKMDVFFLIFVGLLIRLKYFLIKVELKQIFFYLGLLDFFSNFYNIRSQSYCLFIFLLELGLLLNNHLPN